MDGEPRRFIDEVVLPYSGDKCLIWPFARFGTGYALLNIDGKKVLVSRLICDAVNGPPPTPDRQAAHLCGKGHLACIAPGHLVWKTRKENEADKIKHGTSSRGERGSSAKLTTTDVRNIRALKGTLSQSEMGRRFGVGQDQISRILRYERWGWLDVGDARP